MRLHRAARRCGIVSRPAVSVTPASLQEREQVRRALAVRHRERERALAGLRAAVDLQAEQAREQRRTEQRS